MSKYFRWAELPTTSEWGSTKWGNRDIYPIPKEQQTYGVSAFIYYWVTVGVSVTAYTIAAAFIAAGLNVPEAMGAIILGTCLAAVNGYLCGQPGVDKHLPFVRACYIPRIDSLRGHTNTVFQMQAMVSRAAFGLWGSFLPLFFTLFGNIIFVSIFARVSYNIIKLLINL
jgi:NCS1 family nucleobase:cation symporter-1